MNDDKDLSRKHTTFNFVEIGFFVSFLENNKLIAEFQLILGVNYSALHRDLNRSVISNHW